MIRYIIAFILLIHGLIHLIGYSKAFGYSASNVITKEISRPAGSLWMAATLLLVAAAVMMVMRKEYWWIAGAAGMIISQVLIIMAWQDAKFGTIVNILIMVAVIIGYATWHYSRLYEKDVAAGFSGLPAGIPPLLTEADLAGLPEPVKKYIRFTGSVGKPKVTNFRIAFTGGIRGKETAPWMPFTTEQHSFMVVPARLFFMKATMKHLPVSGYHCYKNGDAFMDIRLLSLFRVEYKHGKEMGISETVTFFNDMCCMAPATLIDKRIRWIATEGDRVQAEFTINNITVSAWLCFNEKGELTDWISDDRYSLQEDGTMKRAQWSTPLSDYREINGYRLASQARTLYKYPAGDFCYGTFTVTNVVYNERK